MHKLNPDILRQLRVLALKEASLGRSTMMIAPTVVISLCDALLEESSGTEIRLPTYGRGAAE